MKVHAPNLAIWPVNLKLNGVIDQPTAFTAMCELIVRLIPCDEVVWNSGDTQRRWAAVYAADKDRYQAQVCKLLLETTDNPVRNHYLSGVNPSAAPTRLGDISTDREFRNTRAWAELYRPLGITRQLTIPTALTVSGGTAWSLNRAGSEFSEASLAMAARLQPLLRAVEAGSSRRHGTTDTWLPSTSGLPARHPAPVSDGTQERPSPPQQPLTARELEILSLVGQGLTATSIAFRLRVSVATVRKHLEHVYEKTGQHDRLLAVAYARQCGLLPAA